MWPIGQRRNDNDAARLIRGLLTEFSRRELARRCGVSDRTIRRWANGEDWPSSAALHRLVDAVCPANVAALPIYSPDMALDGWTRLGGVGEYSRRAARGDLEYLEGVCSDWD